MPDKFNELLLKQDIIELYNAGITPDYGYLMNGRFEKDMVKTLYPLNKLSGNPIAWKANGTEYLYPSVSFVPKQEGSGDPSPDNVRPITGYDSLSLTHSNNADATNTYDIALPETVYGGTVDCVTGVGENTYIFKELAISDMDNDEDFPGWRNMSWINDVKHNPKPDGGFDALGIYGVTNIADISQDIFWNSNGTRIYTLPQYWGGKTQSQIKEAYPDLVVQFCLQLVTPTPFQATGNRQLTSFAGYNTIYTNGDSMTLNRKIWRLEV